MKTEEQENTQTQQGEVKNRIEESVPQSGEIASQVEEPAEEASPAELEAQEEVLLAAEEPLAGEAAAEATPAEVEGQEEVPPVVEEQLVKEAAGAASTEAEAQEEVLLAAEEQLAEEAAAEATPAEVEAQEEVLLAAEEQLAEEAAGAASTEAEAQEEVLLAAEEQLAEQAAVETAPAEAEAEEEVQLAAEEQLAEQAAAAKAAPTEAEEAQTEEPPAEEEEIDDGRAWYVVHSYSGYENKVKRNLEHRIASMNMQDRVFRVMVPTEEEIEIREGHRRKTKKRVFPGYILVQMIMDDDSWYVVRNTPGVTGFVSSGTKPTPLRPGEVEKIFKRMERAAPKIKVGFREGQTVRIVDGPFADFVGTVDELNLDKGRVRVLVSFFGRETPVELDFLQVQRQ